MSSLKGKKFHAEGGGLVMWDGNPRRPPKKGEYFLSGAVVAAYLAYNDMTQPYHIAVKCPEEQKNRDIMAGY